LYDWNKDEVITEEDINTVINENEHTLNEGLAEEITLYDIR